MQFRPLGAGGQASVRGGELAAPEAFLIIALVPGVFLLPHLTIAGRHWHVCFLPI